MIFINCTEHDLRLRIDTDNKSAVPHQDDIVLKPSGTVVRCKSTQVLVATWNGFPIYKTVLGDVQNLPDPEGGVVYVVSTPAAQKAARMGREDVVSPNTNPGKDIRYPLNHKLQGLTFCVHGFQTF